MCVFVGHSTKYKIQELKKKFYNILYFARSDLVFFYKVFFFEFSLPFVGHNWQTELKEENKAPPLQAATCRTYVKTTLCFKINLCSVQLDKCKFFVINQLDAQFFFLFISVINQFDAQNFCFTISLFHASTCFEHMYSSSGGQNCITQPLSSLILCTVRPPIGVMIPEAV